MIKEIDKKIKKLKKRRKALIAEKRKSSFTGYGLISVCSDKTHSPRIILLSGYAVKYSLTDDLKYCAIQKNEKQSFLPDMLIDYCIAPISKAEYDLLLSKNSIIEQYLKDNFPDDFNWSE